MSIEIPGRPWTSTKSVGRYDNLVADGTEWASYCGREMTR